MALLINLVTDIQVCIVLIISWQLWIFLRSISVGNPSKSMPLKYKPNRKYFFFLLQIAPKHPIIELSPFLERHKNNSQCIRYFIHLTAVQWMVEYTAAWKKMSRANNSYFKRSFHLEVFPTSAYRAPTDFKSETTVLPLQNSQSTSRLSVYTSWPSTIL